MPDPEPPAVPFGGALKVLNLAIKQVPATRYALAVAGVSAAAAMVRLFSGGDLNKGVLVLTVMFVFVIAMLVFAKMTTLSQGSFKYPALAMLWSCVIFFIASGALALTSVFFGKPLDWRPVEVNTIRTAAAASTATSDTMTAVPRGDLRSAAATAPIMLPPILSTSARPGGPEARVQLRPSARGTATCAGGLCTLKRTAGSFDSAHNVACIGDKSIRCTMLETPKADDAQVKCSLLSDLNETLSWTLCAL